MIYLIRHGESQHDINEQLSGLTDVPMSENVR
jgi:broad specificity phosphatase PhoE